MADLRKYANNFSTTLNGAITDVATSITLTSATGLPSIGANEYYQLTITDGANIEVVNVTDDASSPTLTVTRDADGNGSFDFADLDTVELRANAESFEDVLSADPTPTLRGPLDASGSGVYVGFGGSSSTTAYNLSHSGNIPQLVGAANFKWTFTSSALYAQAGTTFNRLEFTNDSNRLRIYTNNSERVSINDSGIQLGAANARVTTILDEDDMSSDSATSLATQQSIKAYVDSGGTKQFFIIGRASNQSVSNNTNTRIDFDTAVEDADSITDVSTNYRATPTQSGKWLITLAVTSDTSLSSGDYFYIAIRKNGSVVAPTAEQLGASGQGVQSVSAIVDMNGSTDYVDGLVYQVSGASINIKGDTSRTRLSGIKL